MVVSRGLGNIFDVQEEENHTELLSQPWGEALMTGVWKRLKASASAALRRDGSRSHFTSSSVNPLGLV